MRLVLADSALGLSQSRNTAGIYWVAQLLQHEDPLEDRAIWERNGYQSQEPLVAFRQRCEETLADLEGIHAALEERTENLKH
jgi:hypothetical protein